MMQALVTLRWLGLHVAVACGCMAAVSPLAAQADADPLERLVRGHLIVYTHLRSSVVTGDSVSATRPIGVVEPLPPILSARHQKEIRTAEQLYDIGRFGDAAALLRPTLKDEPENAFLLEVYARSLFRVDSLRPKSHEAYLRLVSLLTKRAKPPANAWVLDMWFVDAYWKLALLYLDTENYSLARIEFAKVFLASGRDARMMSQVYPYLAESYFNLGDKGGAQWFVARTLEIDPTNTYVLQFRSP